ncbi:flavoprotein [Nocardioides guangzhouensis]|uniref:Flavoprotein n=1 Tax=Nocardioides guangzhouensis TaxID=2497878 RepID=A0A4Q4ZKL2_9ACTN|nr:NAD(P)-binding domain-containing protein [Nocardioides guangzhouensis]RYP88071.1 flavoprotein [Nocardioides guangzhouensis]
MTHPLVVIGAGPTGLAAAAHAHARGLETVVLEGGDAPGAAVRTWGHVRLFSPWAELVDPAAEKLLADAGWQAPTPTDYPTGADWVADYLQPLADALAATDLVTIAYRHRVTGVARSGRDVMVDAGREDHPFVVHVTGPDGPQRLLASAVIDASGTWGTPNPLGTDGYPAIGEADHADRITYGIPDVADPTTAARYAGKHVAVAGTGASAQNTLVGLARLAQSHPGTQISWLVRRAGVGQAFGGGDNDQLVERGALGKRAQQAAESSLVITLTSFRTVAVTDTADGRLRLESLDGQVVDDVDEVVVVTGFRPDLSFLTEVRLDLDPVLQSPRQLAPLIDPNVHSCGTVYPHGATDLEQPEHNFFLAGMKSYGRAPSFLTLTGFEQTRSIVAAIAGDREAAARVELVLPETGVCGGSGDFDDGAVCGIDQSPSEAVPAVQTNGEGCCSPSASSELLTIGTSDTIQRLSPFRS